MNSHILAINSNFVLEFLEQNYALPTSEAQLYFHQLSNKVQVLNADTDYDKTGNARLYSFYTDVAATNDQYLLDPTPFPYSDINGDVHDESEKTGISSQIPYKIVRLYVRAGWQFNANDAGFAFKISSKYDTKALELINFFAPNGTTLFKPTSKNLYVGDVLYSSYIEFKILDLSILMSTVDIELQTLAADLFGIANMSLFVNSSLSDYKVELNIVDTSSVSVVNLSGSNTGSTAYPFTYFVVNQWATTSKLLVDKLTQLTTYIEQKNTVLEVGLSATGSLSIEQQLLILTDDLVFINIEHYIQINEYDISLTLIGTRKIRVSNDDIEWGESQFIPILQELTDSIKLIVRTRIIASDTGYDISKYSDLVLTTQEVNNLRQSNANLILDVTSTEIVNQIQRQTVQVSANMSKTHNVKLKNKIYFVNYTQFSVLVDDAKQVFSSDDIPYIRLYDEVSYFAFEFYNDNQLIELPKNQMYITESGVTTKIFESSRPSVTKTIFKLSMSQFKGKNIILHNSDGSVISDILIVKSNDDLLQNKIIRFEKLQSIVLDNNETIALSKKQSSYKTKNIDILNDVNTDQ